MPSARASAVKIEDDGTRNEDGSFVTPEQRARQDEIARRIATRLGFDSVRRRNKWDVISHDLFLKGTRTLAAVLNVKHRPQMTDLDSFTEVANHPGEYALSLRKYQASLKQARALGVPYLLGFQCRNGDTYYATVSDLKKDVDFSVAEQAGRTVNTRPDATPEHEIEDMACFPIRKLFKFVPWSIYRDSRELAALNVADVGWAIEHFEKGIVLEHPIQFEERHLVSLNTMRVSFYLGQYLGNVQSGLINMQKPWGLFTRDYWENMVRENLAALHSLRIAYEKRLDSTGAQNDTGGINGYTG